MKGKWIVITRPLHQSSRLKQQLEAAGARVVQYPLIQIDAPTDTALARRKLASVERFDLVIFVSANAVEAALQWSKKEDYRHCHVAAIGKKTAKTLRDKGISVDLVPSASFNSEALLAMPQLSDLLGSSIQHGKGNKKRIAIIRGGSGRSLLAVSLRERGGSVEYIDVYQRRCPQTDCSLLDRQQREGMLDFILLTSAGSVSSLFQLCTNAVDQWHQVTLVLGSERMRKQVPAGFNGKIWIASDPSDETLYNMLIAGRENG